MVEDEVDVWYAVEVPLDATDVEVAKAHSLLAQAVLSGRA